MTEQDLFEPRPESKGTEIALYDTVEAIAARYETRQAEIRRVTEAAERAALEMKEDYLTQHKRQAWQEIIEKSNCIQWMSTEQQQKVTRTLYDTPQDLPEITVEGLRAWLQDLVVASPDMLRDLCREAFEVLTPQASWRDGYKSNENKREIPKSGRVILTWMCDQDKWRTTPRLSYSRNNRLHVLDRVFSLLDNRPKPEDDYQAGEIRTAEGLCRKASDNGESEVETFWGRLKMHLNGNLHIWLTRPDLVKKLTEVAAGKTLSNAA